MEIIQPHDLAIEIENLKQGEKIFIDFPEDVCKRIKLLTMQVQSYENLFMSYINNTCEGASKFNLEKFLVLYSELAMEEQKVIQDALLATVGAEVYNILNTDSGIAYRVDHNLSQLIIFKRNRKGGI